MRRSMVPPEGPAGNLRRGPRALQRIVMASMRDRYVDDAFEAYIYHERGTTMSTIDNTLSKGAVSPVGTAHRTGSMSSRMLYSRLIGALFLAAFAFYGVGFGLVTSVVGAPDFLLTISAHQ